MIDNKRTRGRYYTEGNPFCLKPFHAWAHHAGLAGAKILEPFAGSNNLIKMLKEQDLCKHYESFDVDPSAHDIKKRDTIKNFPEGFDICVTNPPWLARNSATRRGLSFPECSFDDLYKHCLKLCLDNCDYIAAIIPASFLQSRLFRNRLQTYILLHNIMFSDTENPVCLALFGKTSTQVKIYYDETYLGVLSLLEKHLPKNCSDKKVKFNDLHGELGLISFDNTKEPSIRFCHADEIKNYEIKQSSRFITKISGEFTNIAALVRKLNREINKFRKNTKDVFLTPFKGMRDDGFYRRRMDFALARKFINAA